MPQWGQFQWGEGLWGAQDEDDTPNVINLCVTGDYPTLTGLTGDYPTVDTFEIDLEC